MRSITRPPHGSHTRKPVSLRRCRFFFFNLSGLSPWQSERSCMNAIVDPDGPKLVNIASNPVPEGVRVGYFKTSDNVQLRYALWPKSEGAHRGTICLVQGRTEFIEKYFETVADFRRRGFSVATFDWRGQGGSDRLIGNRSLGYVDRFEDYWTDLKSFHGEILLPDCPPPYYLAGHSM